MRQLSRTIYLLGWMAFSAYMINVKPEANAVVLWFLVSTVCFYFFIKLHND